jgi:DNA-binding GntR family transcriptional regulator
LSAADTLPRRIATELSRMIITGRLPPGQRLQETRLATQFRVSRAPIREAIKELERLGLVVKPPRRSAQVRGVTPRDVKEIYEIKTMLEGLAARLAAERITTQELMKLKAIYRQMCHLGARDHRARYVEASRRFHRAFIEASGNSRLVQMYEAMSREIWWLGTMILSRSDRHRTSVQEHGEILDALAARDAKRAQTVTEDHVWRGGELFFEQFLLGKVDWVSPTAERVSTAERAASSMRPRDGRRHRSAGEGKST